MLGRNVVMLSVSVGWRACHCSARVERVVKLVVMFAVLCSNGIQG